ncbi:beta-glucanase [Streptomyces sp. NPDC051243]|uniref:beta-glucanase n=1 Tax=Streptomyces sp. NPDC051243 TaxID=3365646 RepID=UPI0037BB9BE1
MTIDTATFTPTWSEEFDAPIEWGAKWVGDRTSAYRYRDHNPDDDKLDWLDPGCVTVSDGVATFTATPAGRTLDNGRRAWRTGLLTTEYSAEGFRVRTGDHVETRVRLPSGTGAWPALWTWKDGANEVDSFEYHPDNPNLLELSNNVNPASTCHSDADAIAPDRWVTVGTTYGARSVEWYVNGERVFSDGTGVGDDWSAYPILNLSVSAGHWHPAPCGPAPITFAVGHLRVYRGAARW